VGPIDYPSPDPLVQGILYFVTAAITLKDLNIYRITDVIQLDLTQQSYHDNHAISLKFALFHYFLTLLHFENI